MLQYLAFCIKSEISSNYFSQILLKFHCYWFFFHLKGKVEQEKMSNFKKVLKTWKIE